MSANATSHPQFDTKVLKVDPNSISFSPSLHISDDETQESLTQAASVIKNSQTVAFPTETVYGLGGSALDTLSVKAIYAAKNRPADNPLIAHVASLDQLKRKLYPHDIPDIYLPLIEKFWPGPLTILLPVPEDSKISPACTVGQSTFAVRMPSHPVARALIALSDEPLAAPSANASTRPSPTRASHVFNDLNGRIPIILDGGPCDVGVESSVVDGLSDPPMLLRPGGISLEQLRQFGGPEWQDVVLAKPFVAENEVARTPGMKYKHYSPTSPVVLTKPNTPSQKLLDFVSSKVKATPEMSVGVLSTRHFVNDGIVDEIQKLLVNGQVHHRSLGTIGSDISHNLFAYLRDFDIMGLDLIVVEGIDISDEGLAVMNRLEKAATTLI